MSCPDHCMRQFTLQRLLTYLLVSKANLSSISGPSQIEVIQRWKFSQSVVSAHTKRTERVVLDDNHLELLFALLHKYLNTRVPTDELSYPRYGLGEHTALTRFND